MSLAKTSKVAMFGTIVRFVVASATFVALTGNAIGQEQIADRPNLSVGDTWQYQFKNERAFHPGCVYSISIETITNSRIYARIQFPKECEVGVTTASPVRPDSLQEYDLDFNHLHRSTTAYKAFDFPLNVGKTWSLDYEWHINGWTYNDKLTGKVDAFEKVTTPAGTFGAFKISLRRKYLGSKPGSNSQSGVLEDTFWYSPEVKNFVKRIYDDGRWAYIVRELVKFELHD